MHRTPAQPIRRAVATSLAAAIAVGGVVAFPSAVFASGSTTLLDESFTNASVADSNWTSGGTFTPCLTAGAASTTSPLHGCGLSSPDAAGSGALRLTSNGGSLAGYVLYNHPFPTQAGLSVTFDQYQYGGSNPGADGISFFISDGAHNLAAPGAMGGYLGYAGGSSGVGTGEGVYHGIFGVGIDAYGNYSNFANPSCTAATITLSAALSTGAAITSIPVNATTRALGPGTVLKITSGTSSNTLTTTADAPVGSTSLGVAAFTPAANYASGTSVTYVSQLQREQIGVRGPGALNGSGKWEDGYCWLGGMYPLQESIDQQAQTSRTGTGVHRTVTITADPTNDPTNYPTPHITVKLDYLDGKSDTLQALEPTGMPSTFKFGFAASTGGANDIHEINNLAVSTVEPLQPSWGIGITTSSGWTAGGSGTITLTNPYSDPAWGSETVPVTVSATLPAPVTVSALPSGSRWDCSATVVGSNAVSCTYSASSTSSIEPGTTLANVVIPVALAAGTSGPQTIDASITSSDNHVSGSSNVSTTVSTIAPGAGTMTVATTVNAAQFTQQAPAPTGTGPFTYQLLSGPSASWATASMSASGLLTLTPAAGVSGTAPAFTYQVTDAGGNVSAPANVDLTIAPQTDALTAATVGTTTATLTPSPAGTGPWTYAIASAPANGAASVSAGTLRYTAANGFTGSDSFTYTATGASGVVSAPATATVSVTAPTGPSTAGGSQVIAAGAGGSIAVSATGAQPFTWVIGSQPAGGGTVAISGSGGANATVTYTPPATPFSGTATATYTVTDAYGQPGTGTATWTVTPVAAPASGSGAGGSTLVVPFPAPDATCPCTYALASTPPSSQGTASVSGDQLSFTPAAGFQGAVSGFTYTVTDASGQTSPVAAVALTITAPAAPVANPVAATGDAGSTFAVASDASGTGALTYSLASQPGAGAGSATIDAVTGRITITASPSFSGTSTVAYTVTDGWGGTSTATVTLTIRPAASDVTGSGTGPAPIAAQPAAPLGAAPFTYALVAGSLPPAAQGGATIDPSTGAITFTPALGFSGTVDTFEYTATGGGQTSLPATVSITVAAPAPPTAADLGLGGVSGSSYSATPATTGTGPLSFALDGAGSATMSSTTGAFAYDSTGVSGAEVWTYTVTDPYGQSASAQITVTVTPVAQPFSGSGTAPAAVVAGAPAPAATCPCTYALASTPPAADGTASMAASGANAGEVTFTPALSFAGAVPSLSYTVTDAAGLTSAPVAITLTLAAPAPPQVADLRGTTPVDTPITLNPAAPTGSAPYTWALVVAGLPPAQDGSAAIAANGAVTWTPAAGVSGPVPAFDIVVTDRYGQTSAPAAVHVTVAPSAPPALTTGATGTTITLQLPAPTGTGPFTWTLGSPLPPAADGTVTLNPTTGALTFVAAPGYSGPVPSFPVQVTDAHGAATTTTVTLTITPLAGAAHVTATNTGAPIAVAPPAPQGRGPWTYALVASSLPPAADGRVSIDASSGAVTFLPAAAYTGSFSVRYTVADASGTVSPPATVSFDVLGAVTTVPAPDTGARLLLHGGQALAMIVLGLVALAVRRRLDPSGNA